MRDVYDGLQDLLAHTARQIADGLEEEYSRMLDVMYFPQLVYTRLLNSWKGYLVTVPIGEDGQPAFLIDGWDHRFSTNENAFYKCSETYDKTIYRHV